MNHFNIKLLGLYNSPPVLSLLSDIILIIFLLKQFVNHSNETLVLPLLFDIILIIFLLKQCINHYNDLFQNNLFSFILPTYKTLFILERFYDFRVFMVKELKDFRVLKF